MIDARSKLDAAQTLRVDASTDDREAEPYRSTVRIVELATKENAEIMDTNKFLDARIDESSKAEVGAKARATAAEKRKNELGAEAAALMKDFMTLEAELFQPALKNVEENINGDGLTAKNSTDQAAISIAKARFAAIQMDAVDQAMSLMAAAQSMGAPVGDGEAQLRAQRDKLAENAKAALVEARDALSGVESGAGAPMLRSIAELAAALGIEVPATAAPAAAASTDESAPAGDAPPADDAAPATDAAPADQTAPATDPDGTPVVPPAPAGDPAAAPAGEPAPAPAGDPTADPAVPPQADPTTDPEEPNK
jgi:hypothetical protein